MQAWTNPAQRPASTWPCCLECAWSSLSTISVSLLTRKPCGEMVVQQPRKEEVMGLKVGKGREQIIGLYTNPTKSGKHLPLIPCNGQPGQHTITHENVHWWPNGWMLGLKYNLPKKEVDCFCPIGTMATNFGVPQQGLWPPILVNPNRDYGHQILVYPTRDYGHQFKCTPIRIMAIPQINQGIALIEGPV